MGGGGGGIFVVILIIYMFQGSRYTLNKLYTNTPWSRRGGGGLKSHLNSQICSLNWGPWLRVGGGGGLRHANVDSSDTKESANE